MAAAIGNLSLILSASPAEMTKALDKAGASVKDFGDKTATVSASFSPFSVAFDAIGKVAGATIGTFQSLKGELLNGLGAGIDANSKLADRLGVSTEALVGMQHAANLSGVSAETLTTSLQKLNINLAHAETAGEKSGASLAQFGLDAEALAKMPLEERLIALSNAYNALDSDVSKAGLSFAAFGKGGQSMGTLLAAGPEQIRSMVKEVGPLGTAFTRAQGAAVEAARDSLTRFDEAIKGFKVQALAAIAPIMTPISDALTGFAIKGIAAFKQLIATIEPIATKIGATLGPTLLEGANWVWDKFSGLVDGAFKVINEVAPIAVAWFGAAAAQVRLIGSFLGQAVDWVANLVGSSVNLGGIWDTIKMALLRYYIGVEFVANNFKKIWSVAINNVQFSFHFLWEEIKFAATVTIPAVIKYLGENFSKILTSAFTVVLDNFKTMTEAIQNSGKSLAEWMAGGFQGTPDFGVGAALDKIKANFAAFELPAFKIPHRVITDKERKWAAEIMAGWTGLWNDLDVFTQKRLKEILGNAPDLAATALKKKIALPTTQVELPQTQDKFAAAVLKGSSEAISAINKYQFNLGQEGNLPARQLAEAQKATEQLRQANGALDAIRKAVGVEVDL